MPERPITFVCLDCARRNQGRHSLGEAACPASFDSLNEAWRHMREGHEVHARTNDDDCLPEEKL
jgi:hypothetical protein